MLLEDGESKFFQYVDMYLLRYRASCFKTWENSNLKIISPCSGIEHSFSPTYIAYLV